MVGESGSGKSTLARLLARLITPTSGEVLLAARPVPPGDHGRRGYRRQVQLVLQDPFSSLNPVHDVRYHLARPLRVHGLARRADRTRRSSACWSGSRSPRRTQFICASTRTSCPAASASAWRSPARSRCGRGCCSPTSRSRCWTCRSGSGVLNLLADLRDTERLAILYITHDIASARYLADTIAVMYAGQVVESGPAARGHRRARAPVHAAAARRGARPRAGRRRPAARPRRAAEPGGTAARLPVPPALPARDGDLRRAPPPATARRGAGHTSACWLHTPHRFPHPTRRRRDEPGDPVAGTGQVPSTA